jgi:hypothetical protein
MDCPSILRPSRGVNAAQPDAPPSNTMVPPGINQYYIAVNGNDSRPCSEMQPCRMF